MTNCNCYVVDNMTNRYFPAPVWDLLFEYADDSTFIVMPQICRLANKVSNIERHYRRRIVVMRLLAIEKMFDNQTKCREAVQEDGRNIRYVIDQTDELCKLAMNSRSPGYRHSSRNIKYIRNQTPELCFMSLHYSPYNLKYIRPEFQTKEICEVALRTSGYMIRYIREDLVTPELCLLAVNTTPDAIGYIKGRHLTQDICLAAVKKSPSTVMDIPREYRTKEMFEEYVKFNPKRALYRLSASEQTIELCQLAVEKDPKTVKRFKNKTMQYYRAAMEANPKVVMYL